MGFMANKMTLKKNFSLIFFGFPLLNIIPPLLHTLLSPPPVVCDSPEQAAHYQSVGLKFGVSYLNRHLAGYLEKTLRVFKEGWRLK
jgi:hypothetical protein